VDEIPALADRNAWLFLTHQLGLPRRAVWAVPVGKRDG
jgi:hypothetical protein